MKSIFKISIESGIISGFLIICLAAFIGAFRPSPAAIVGNASQAILSFSPEAAFFNVNDVFTVSIYLNTGGQSVVAVGTYINYDKEHFEVVSVDTVDSVFAIELQKEIYPSYGLVQIIIGKFAPGVNTANGLVAKITFKAFSAVSPDSDNLNFVFAAAPAIGSAVIKDDGLATDILSGVHNAKYSVAAGGGGGGEYIPTPAPAETPVETPIETPSPVITPVPMLIPTSTSTVTPTPVPTLIPAPSFVLLPKLIFQRNLRFGSSGRDVTELQNLLANSPIGGEDVYPEGLVTGFFGRLTEKAVQRFQCKYQVVCGGSAPTTGYGLVGPRTRAKLNELTSQIQ